MKLSGVMLAFKYQGAAEDCFYFSSFFPSSFFIIAFATVSIFQINLSTFLITSREPLLPFTAAFFKPQVPVISCCQVPDMGRESYDNSTTSKLICISGIAFGIRSQEKNSEGTKP